MNVSRTSSPNRSAILSRNSRRPSSVASFAAVGSQGRRSNGTPAGYRQSLSRPSTTGSTAAEGGSYAVAVLQSKGTGVEVGLAALNLDTGRLTLTQSAETPAYSNTLHYLLLHPPSSVIVTDTQVSNTQSASAFTRKERPPLIERIEDEYDLRCDAVARVHWNAEAGLDLIKRLAIEDDSKSSTVMTASDRYYALCAASALIHFVGSKRKVVFNDKSLRIVYESMKGHMFINSETARNLELVQNNLTMKDQNTLYCGFGATCDWATNRFATLDSCFTPMGKRLLRASILQPNNYRVTVENRLDAVEELIEAPDKLRGIRKHLKSIENIDFDRIIANFSQDERKEINPNQTESRIGWLLQLRKVVSVLPGLANVLSSSEISSSLLQVLADKLSQADNGLIVEIINESIADDVTLDTGRGSTQQRKRNARLFAVKNTYNQLLDLARETLKENKDDIQELVEQTQEEFGVSVSLEWGETGYRFSCPRSELDGKPLPRGLLSIDRSKHTAKFTTHELLKRNSRMLQTQQEVFLLSDETVAQVVQDIVCHIDCLYHASEELALLDMLASFAEISSTADYVRPKIGSALAIRNGRHPILEATLPHGAVIPNDVYAADGPANFQLIQGPNMSGKSTYLRQIGLLTVQGMVGCFLPAEHATIRLPDYLLTRLSNDDNMAKSLSTFALEMASSAMILGMATGRSLILIDELGRGTAPIEGVGLCQAIAEQLIKARSFVFFATHFHELAQTLSVYPGVVTLHLQVTHERAPDDDSEVFASTFQYKVVEGAIQRRHYGLELASLAALPRDVLTTARTVATRLNDLEQRDRNSTLAAAQATRRKVILELRGKLKHVLQASAEDDPAVLEYLLRLQEDLKESLQSVLALESEAGSDIAQASTATL